MSIAQKNELIKNPSAKAGFASAVVLAAGLAVMPGCVKPEQLASPKSPVSSVQKAPGKNSGTSDLVDQKALLQKITEMAKRSPELLRQSGIDEFDVSKLKVNTSRFDVKIGDEVHGGLFDNKTLSSRVTKIDDKGVEVDNDFFEYDKPRTMVVTSGGSFLLTSIVRAEKGAEGTAVISVTHTEYSR